MKSIYTYVLVLPLLAGCSSDPDVASSATNQTMADAASEEQDLGQVVDLSQPVDAALGEVLVQTCEELVTCVGTCEGSGVDCGTQCAQGAPSQVALSSTSLSLCMKGSDCSDVTCAQKECANEWSVCLGEDPPVQDAGLVEDMAQGASDMSRPGGVALEAGFVACEGQDMGQMCSWMLRGMEVQGNCRVVAQLGDPRLFCFSRDLIAGRDMGGGADAGGTLDMGAQADMQALPPFAACEGKAEAQACEYTNRNGEKVVAVCQARPAGEGLVCR